MSSEAAPGPIDERRPVRWLQLIIAASALCSLSAIVWGRGLNYDEIEFFRASRWIARGLVPYRDFWEHHSPLAWYLFAPFTHAGSGIVPLVAVRLAQLPLWVAALWALHQVTRRSGATRFASWVSLALLVTSYVFSIKAIEYRVDTAASLFLIAGLLALLYAEGLSLLLLSGTLMTLAVLSNIRLLPLAAAATLLASVFHAGKWMPKRLFWPFAGGAATGVLYVAYLFTTGSAAAAWRQLIVQNALGDRFAVEPLSGRVALFGRAIGIVWTPNGLRFSAADIDLACTVLFLLGVAGVVLALKDALRVGPLQILAALQIINIVAVIRMKVTYLYHLEIVALLMVPLAASAIDAASLRTKRLNVVQLMLAISAVVLCLQIFTSVFRADHLVLRTQDELMRDMNTRWRGTAVFDAVGYGYEARPAWRFWFIPLLVENLVRHGLVPPLDASTLARSNPSVVIYTFRMGRFLSWQPELARYVTHYYAPLNRFVWTRALNAIVEGGAAAKWTAPVGGVYHVYASRVLARHPWFRQPLGAAWASGEEADILEVHLPEFTEANVDVELFENGAPLVLEKGAIRIRAGSTVECRNRGTAAAAVVLMPSNDSILFRRLRHGAAIEAGDLLPPAHPPW